MAGGLDVIRPERLIGVFENDEIRIPQTQIVSTITCNGGNVVVIPFQTGKPPDACFTDFAGIVPAFSHLLTAILCFPSVLLVRSP